MPDPTTSHPQHKSPAWRRLLDAQIQRAEAWNAHVETLGDFALEGGAASLESGARIWREALGGSLALHRRCWAVGRRLLGQPTTITPTTKPSRPTITVEA